MFPNLDVNSAEHMGVFPLSSLKELEKRFKSVNPLKNGRYHSYRGVKSIEVLPGLKSYHNGSVPKQWQVFTNHCIANYPAGSEINPHQFRAIGGVPHDPNGHPPLMYKSENRKSFGYQKDSKSHELLVLLIKIFVQGLCSTPEVLPVHHKSNGSVGFPFSSNDLATRIQAARFGSDPRIMADMVYNKRYAVGLREYINCTDSRYLLVGGTLGRTQSEPIEKDRRINMFRHGNLVSEIADKSLPGETFFGASRHRIVVAPNQFATACANYTLKGHLHNLYKKFPHFFKMHGRLDIQSRMVGKYISKIDITSFDQNFPVVLMDLFFEELSNYWTDEFIQYLKSCTYMSFVSFPSGSHESESLFYNITPDNDYYGGLSSGNPLTPILGRIGGMTQNLITLFQSGVLSFDDILALSTIHLPESKFYNYNHGLKILYKVDSMGVGDDIANLFKFAKDQSIFKDYVSQIAKDFSHWNGSGRKGLSPGLWMIDYEDDNKFLGHKIHTSGDGTVSSVTLADSGCLFNLIQPERSFGAGKLMPFTGALVREETYELNGTKFAPEIYEMIKIAYQKSTNRNYHDMLREGVAKEPNLKFTTDRAFVISKFLEDPSSVHWHPMVSDAFHSGTIPQTVIDKLGFTQPAVTIQRLYKEVMKRDCTLKAA